MRTRTLFVLLMLSFVVGLRGASAQIADGSRGSFPGCPTCGVYSYVDLPEREATISASNFVLQGWGFECFSGAPADRVEIFYQGYDGYWTRLPQGPSALNYGSILRPDVRDAYAPACSAAPSNSGWYLVVTNPPPLGLRRLQINVWHGPYFEAHRRTYLVTP